MKGEYPALKAYLNEPARKCFCLGLCSCFYSVIMISLFQNQVTLSSRSAPVRDLALRNRCTLKIKDPLIAAEGYVVRQRSTVLREDQDQDPETSSG